MSPRTKWNTNMDTKQLPGRLFEWYQADRKSHRQHWPSVHCINCCLELQCKINGSKQIHVLGLLCSAVLSGCFPAYTSLSTRMEVARWSTRADALCWTYLCLVMYWWSANNRWKLHVNESENDVVYCLQLMAAVYVMMSQLFGMSTSQLQMFPTQFWSTQWTS